MESYGVYVPLALAQLCNLLLLIAWVVLTVVALLRLRNTALTPGLQLAWVVLAVLVPVLGALAVLIVRKR